MGLYTSTILGGNSYLSWFNDRGAIKDPAHTGTSKGLSQAINRGPIRIFLPKYANVSVTIQGHGLSAGVQTHYVTANGVRDGLPVPCSVIHPDHWSLFSPPQIQLWDPTARRRHRRADRNGIFTSFWYPPPPAP